LILRHEFLHTIRRTGFIILTLSLPILALLGIGIYKIVTSATNPTSQVTTIGYVDEAGGFDQFTAQGNINFVPFDTTEAATQALVNKDMSEYFVIPQDFVSTGAIPFYTTQKQLAPPDSITTAIDNFITQNLLAGKVAEDVIARVEAPLNVATINLTSTGAVASQQGGYANIIVPSIFGFLLAGALMLTNIYLLQSLSAEKENRLMEILLSSVSTRQLLAGKVLGLGAAGLVEVLVWVITLPFLLNLASSAIGGSLANVKLPAGFLAFGVVYFILGYLVFAVVSACIAAITSTFQEAQTFSSFYAIFSIAPFWLLSLLILYPNSAVWIAFSIFPFSAPVMVMLRLGMTGVPAWQLAASMGVLALSFVGGLLLAAKLLRAYILMYGKRPHLGEIVRALRSE